MIYTGHVSLDGLIGRNDYDLYVFLYEGVLGRMIVAFCVTLI